MVNTFSNLAILKSERRARSLSGASAAIEGLATNLSKAVLAAEVAGRD